jgi:hypothetical protein
MTIPDFGLWVKQHLRLIYAIAAVLLFVFWKVVINFPVWATGMLLSLYYTEKRLAEEMDISSESGSYVTVSQQPGRSPAINDLKLKLVNRLRFWNVEVRRIDLEVWTFHQRLLTRDQFLGEVVKSAGSLVLTFDIELDGFRLARITDTFPPQPPTAIDVELHLTLHCSTFFKRFTVTAVKTVSAKIYR